jgi:hypothetical protein
MQRDRRPTQIAFGALGVFATGFVAFGLIGWGSPAANEQAIGEVSRWCERVSGGFLREPVNTLGNLGFVVAGLAMFATLARDASNSRPRINRFIGNSPVALLYASATVFLGPGSMVMHGTHTFFGAWLDNVSMVAYILIPVLLNLSVLGRWTQRTLFATYTIVLAGYAAGYWFIGPDLGIGFELFRVSIPLWIISEVLIRWWSTAVRWLSGLGGFVVAAAFGIFPSEMIANASEYWWVFLFWLPGALARDRSDLRRTYTPWFWAGIASFLLAYTIWQTGTAGHQWCSPDSLLQAHAIWHVLSAAATWSFFVFLRTERRVSVDAGELVRPG